MPCTITEGCTHRPGHQGLCHVPDDQPGPKTTEQVDHKAVALGLLRLLYGGVPLSVESKQQAALVHSNLAIAEGQERVAEEIKAFRELMARSAT